jgi:hypothetical protein
MNELSKAAAMLGRKGGKSGTGASKARSSEVARIAALRRWSLHKFGTVSERFWRKVNKGSSYECWIWIAHKNKKGYGNFDANSKKHKSKLAPRISWELTHGDIPVGMCVLHKCDNPACVNPSHLYLGTQRENTNDFERKILLFERNKKRNGKTQRKRRC